MQFFLDTANLDEIREAWNMGVIGGVTTNPSLVSKEGKDFTELLKSISDIVEGPISAEVISLDAQGMIAEGTELAKLSPNIVIKVPMTEEGLKAVKALSNDGIKTNVTLIFTPLQALLAARAGATYVSPFVGRLDDIGEVGMQIVEDICDIFTIHDLDTKVIVASVRNPIHVLESARLGADYATVPFKVLQQLFKHPLTDAGIDKFLTDWKKMEK